MNALTSKLHFWYGGSSWQYLNPVWMSRSLGQGHSGKMGFLDFCTPNYFVMTNWSSFGILALTGIPRKLDHPVNKTMVLWLGKWSTNKPMVLQHSISHPLIMLTFFTRQNCAMCSDEWCWVTFQKRIRKTNRIRHRKCLCFNKIINK